MDHNQGPGSPEPGFTPAFPDASETLTVRVRVCARKLNVGTIQACVMLVLLNIYIRVTAPTRSACVRACLVAAVVLVPRVGAPPPQFDGRGAQQVLDAAPDRAASLRRHRVVSLSASCFSHRPRPVFVSSDSRPAAAVMLPAWFRLCTGWVDGLRFCRCCTASQTCAAVKRRSGLNTMRSGMTASAAAQRSREHFRSSFWKQN